MRDRLHDMEQRVSCPFLARVGTWQTYSSVGVPLEVESEAFGIQEGFRGYRGGLYDVRCLKGYRINVKQGLRCGVGFEDDFTGL